VPPLAEPTPARGQPAGAEGGEPPAGGTPRPVGVPAPSSLARRARSWWASRWRLWVTSLGVVATLTAVGIGVLQQWIAWRTQDVLVERALQRYASYSARIFVDGMHRYLVDLPNHALSPALGASAWSSGNVAPIALGRFERYLRTTPMWPMLARDSLLAVATIDYRAGRDRRISVRTIGTRADSAAIAEIVQETRAGAEEWIAFNSPGTGFHGRVNAELYNVVWSWQRDADARPVALVLLATDARARLRVGGGALFRRVPLLPPPILDEASVDAADADDAPMGLGGDSVLAFNRRRLAIRLRDAVRPALVFYASPNWSEPWVARSTHRGVAPAGLGNLEVEAVLNPDVRTDFPEARASRSAQLMLGGILALAGVLALAAIGGLRRRQELAQTRELFVSSISHELRTPLTQIRLFSESLLNDRARSPEQGRRWMRVIDREARRLGDLVDNALLYARAQRHDVQLAAEPLDLHELMAAVTEATRPFAAARDASIEVSLPREARVRGDERALRHVLQNLVDNALKYGPSGQTVRVTASRGAPGTLDVAVADEGPGVPGADRERIWEPFVRLESDDGIGGTGLGLNVVRTLVQALGGRVWVEDAPAGGARFVVRLPLA
jgi:signal transduction histidine kinase